MSSYDLSGKEAFENYVPQTLPSPAPAWMQMENVLERKGLPPNDTSLEIPNQDNIKNTSQTGVKAGIVAGAGLGAIPGARSIDDTLKGIDSETKFKEKWLKNNLRVYEDDLIKIMDSGGERKVREVTQKNILKTKDAIYKNKARSSFAKKLPKIALNLTKEIPESAILGIAGSIGGGFIGLALEMAMEAFDATDISRSPSEKEDYDKSMSIRRESGEKKMSRARKEQTGRTKELPRSIEDIKRMAQERYE